MKKLKTFLCILMVVSLLPMPVFAKQADREASAVPAAAVMEPDEPPAEEPPTEELPSVEEPPAEEQPVEEPPAGEPPAEEPPAEETPVEAQQVEESTAPCEEPGCTLESGHKGAHSFGHEGELCTALGCAIVGVHAEHQTDALCCKTEHCKLQNNHDGDCVLFTVEEQLRAAVESGGAVTFEQDVTLTVDLTVPSGVTLTLSGALTVPENLTLTVEGTLKLTGTADVCGTLDNAASGSIRIELDEDRYPTADCAVRFRETSVLRNAGEIRTYNAVVFDTGAEYSDSEEPITVYDGGSVTGTDRWVQDTSEEAPTESPAPSEAPVETPPVSETPPLRGANPVGDGVTLLQSVHVFSHDGTTVIIGKKIQLSFGFSPGNATNRSVSWSVENETGSATIQVDELGDCYVTGVTAGTVTVTATANDGGGAYGSVQVQVVSADAYAVTGGNIYYSASMGSILSCDPTVTAAVIPAEIAGTAIISIAEVAFRDCTLLQTVTVPNSVTSIGSWAFDGCSALNSITIPTGVTVIDWGTFRGCSALNSITIPTGVTRIDCWAFRDCSSLTTIAVPKETWSIGSGAFSGCSSLESITVHAENATYYTMDGLLYRRDNKQIVACPGAKQGTVTVADGTESILENAFSGCSGLTAINIPGTVTSLSYSAFSGCSGLTSFSIPNSVTSIGIYAFEGCSGLTALTIPDSVESIGSWAFHGCSSLTSLTIPNSVTSIDDYAFYYCSGLTSLTIPDSVTSIGASAFYGCTALTDVHFDGTWEQWAAITKGSGNEPLLNAALHCTDTAGTVVASGVCGANLAWTLDNDGLLTVSGTGDMTDYSWSEPAPWDAHKETIIAVVIESGVTSVGDRAFRDCSGLTSVIIPDSVTSIGEYAFSGCESLGSVVIPDGVISIDEGAFYYCSGLTSVIIPNSVTSVGEWALFGCSGLTSLTIPNSVTSIGGSAFLDCSGLTSLTIPNSVTSIGYSAFSHCSGLTSLTIPNSVTSIGCDVFFGCSSLTSITIPVSVTSIDDYAFFGCSSLTSITIPVSVTNIGWDAFGRCGALADVYYAGTEAQWNAIGIGEDGNFSLRTASKHFAHAITASGTCGTGLTWSLDNEGQLTVSGAGDMTDYASGGAPWYANRASILSVRIEPGVTGIGAYAFENCSALTSIRIPNTVLTVRDGALSGCTALTNIAYTGSAAQWAAVEIAASNAGRISAATVDMFSAAGAALRAAIAANATTTWTAADGDITLTADLVIPESHTLIMDGSVTLTIPSGIRLINNGMIKMRNGAAIRVLSGGALMNQSGIDLESGSLTVASGGRLNTDNGIDVYDGSLIAEDGAVVYSDFCEGGDGVHLMVNGTGTIRGVDALLFGELSTEAELRNAMTDARCEHIRRYLLVSTDIVLTGDLTIPWGADLNIYGQGRLTVPSGVTLTIEGDLEVDGSLTVNAGGAIVCQGGSLRINADAQYINNGTYSGDGRLRWNTEVATEAELRAAIAKGCTDITVTQSMKLTADLTVPKTVVSLDINSDARVTVPAGVTLTNRARIDGPVTVKSGGTLRNEGNIMVFSSAELIVETGGQYIAAMGSTLTAGKADAISGIDKSKIVLRVYPDTEEEFRAACSETEFGDLQIGIYSSDFAWTQDITIPANATVTCYRDMAGDMAVPSGVTVTNNGTLHFAEGTTLTIDAGGVLINNGVLDTHQAKAFVNNGTLSGTGQWLRAIWSGVCGEDMTCILDSAGTLYLYGYGSMYSYDDSAAPWNSFRSNIRKVELKGYIESIGGSAFYDCDNLVSVTLSDDVTEIGASAFYGCTALTDVHFDGTLAQWAAITKGSGNEPLLNAALHCTDTAGTVVASGVCGANLAWTLDNDGLLTVSGTGAMTDYRLLTVSGTGDMTDYDLTADIPWYSNRAAITSVVMESGVTSVGDSAFSYCSGLTSVIIPDSVTSIGCDAFFGCSSLTSITIPVSVTSIGYSAFQGCSGLTSLTIPNSVTSIGESAFSRCSGLTGDLVIPDGVTSIGEHAFWGCSGLTSVVLPTDIGIIAFGAFGECSGLTGTLDIPDSVISIIGEAFVGCSGLTGVTLPSSVTEIGYNAFYGCSGLTGVTIPLSVTQIGFGAFSACNGLTAITVDAASEHFCAVDGILYDKDMQKLISCPAGKQGTLTVPSGVTELDEDAFALCSGLTSIVLPDSLTTIGDTAFLGCDGLTEITLPCSVDTIHTDIFFNCPHLMTIRVAADNLNFVSVDGVLYSKDGTWLVAYPAARSGAMYRIPDGVELVGWEAFSAGNLQTLIVPASVSSFGLTRSLAEAVHRVHFLGSSDCIETNANLMEYEGFTVYYDEGASGWDDSVSWWDEVRCLPFVYATGITVTGESGASTVAQGGTLQMQANVLPEGAIDKSVTWSVTNGAGSASITQDGVLTGVNAGAVTVKATANDGSGVTGTMVVTVAASEERTYAVTGGNITYNTLGTITDCDPTVTTAVIPSQIDGVTIRAIGDFAFEACADLISLSIPNTVTSVGDYAFSRCYGLTALTLPNSVIHIGNWAFGSCSKLSVITIEEGNTVYCSVDGILYLLESGTPAALLRCPQARTSAVIIPTGVTSIEEEAFFNCSDLTSITIPSGVTDLGNWAFRGCRSLTALIIPDSVTTIGDLAFSDCCKLTSLTIPAGVSRIGYSAFYDCSGLTSITIPAGVSSIGEDAFYGCSGMTAITVEAGNAAYASKDGMLYNASLTSLLVCPPAWSGRVWISEGVTRIEDYAFIWCKNLTSITIPTSVEYVGDSFHETEFDFIRFRCDESVVNDHLSLGSDIPIYFDEGTTGWTTPVYYQYYEGDPQHGIPGWTEEYSCLPFVSVTSMSVGTQNGASTVAQGGTLQMQANVLPTGAIDKSVTWSVTNGAGSASITQDGVLTGVNAGAVTVKAAANDGSGVTGTMVVTVAPKKVTGITVTADSATVVKTGALQMRVAVLPNDAGNKSVTWSVTNGAGSASITQAGVLTGVNPGQVTVRATASDGSGTFGTMTVTVTPKRVASITVTGADTVVGGQTATYTAAVLPTDADNHSVTWSVSNGTGTATVTQTGVLTGGTAGTVTIRATASDGSGAVGQKTVTVTAAAQTSTVTIPAAPAGSTVFVDGAACSTDESGSIALSPGTTAASVTAYNYNSTSTDPHRVYPIGMEVWLIQRQPDGTLKAVRTNALDNILQYAGSSIRITGTKGIRMVTSVPSDLKQQLIANGLYGYNLQEYGTCVAWVSEMAGGALVLGASYTKSAYAYKEGVSDPVFKLADGMTQYTNVLVGFTNEQCVPDLAMRPYMILKNAAGQTVTLYGGTVIRSIGYIAYQNRAAFEPGTEAYAYIWDIIHHVYGNRYDAEYRG